MSGRQRRPREQARYCRAASTGRSVIGGTDIDGVGIGGLESGVRRPLGHGLRPAGSTSEVAPGGRSIAGSETVTVPPVPGDDIVLTLDRSIQYAAEQALLRRVGETAVPAADRRRDGHRLAATMLRDGVGRRNDAGRRRGHDRATSRPSTPTSPARWPRSSRSPRRSTRAPSRPTATSRARGARAVGQRHARPTPTSTPTRAHGRPRSSSSRRTSGTIPMGKDDRAPDALGVHAVASASARCPRSASRASRTGILKHWKDMGAPSASRSPTDGRRQHAVQLAAAVNAIANDGMYVARRDWCGLRRGRTGR